jgi:hypothetical protein
VRLFHVNGSLWYTMTYWVLCLSLGQAEPVTPLSFDHSPVASFLECAADQVVVEVDLVASHPDAIMRYQAHQNSETVMPVLQEAFPGATWHPLRALPVIGQQTTMARYQCHIPWSPTETPWFDFLNQVRKNMNQLEWPAGIRLEIRALFPTLQNPEKHRDTILQMIHGDTRKLQTAFGNQSTLILQGLENPVQAATSGQGKIQLYIPYDVRIECHGIPANP